MAAFIIQTYGRTVGDTAVPLTLVGIGAMLGNLPGGRIVSLARG
jgi:predicted MFS family arabinose efflux permease